MANKPPLNGGHLRGFIVWGPSNVADCLWSVVGVHWLSFCARVRAISLTSQVLHGGEGVALRTWEVVEYISEFGSEIRLECSAKAVVELFSFWGCV